MRRRAAKRRSTLLVGKPPLEAGSRLHGPARFAGRPASLSPQPFRQRSSGLIEEPPLTVTSLLQLSDARVLLATERRTSGAARCTRDHRSKKSTIITPAFRMCRLQTHIADREIQVKSAVRPPTEARHSRLVPRAVFARLVCILRVN